jgi:four helix bundle protein
MKENNVLAEKTIAFAIRIVNCAKFLQNEKNEHIMSKQILRSGTSIGANVHEGIYAQSKADFISKLSISLKEASETSYWLTILYRTNYINQEIFQSFKDNIDEIIRIIISAIKTAKKNME